MKKRYRALSFALMIAFVFITFQTDVSALSYSGKYGDIFLTDPSYKEKTDTVTVYGSSDYLHFIIDSVGAEEASFVLKIYEDENLKNQLKQYKLAANGKGSLKTAKGIALTSFSDGVYYGSYYVLVTKNGKSAVDNSTKKTFRLNVERNAEFSRITPVIKTLSVSGNGVSLNWCPVKEAKSYGIFRKSAKGEKFTKIASVGSDIREYRDETVLGKSGKYYYTVRASNGKKSSSYLKDGTVAVWCEKPLIGSVSVGAGNRITLGWSACPGVDGYILYKIADGGAVKRLAAVSGDGTVSFTDKSSKKSGTEYTYLVRGFITLNKKDVLGPYDREGRSVVFTAAPKIQSAFYKNGGVELTWGNVAGATKYGIYRADALKSSRSAWKRIGSADQGTTFFRDTSAEKNTKYYYTVRSYSGKTNGSYDSSGRFFVYPGLPDRGTFDSPAMVGVDSETWNYTLVNSEFRIPSTYAPTLKRVCSTDKTLDSRVAPHYEAMYNAALKDGARLTPYSGYRSYSYQKKLYENRIKTYTSAGYSYAAAKKKAATINMPPGSSEHNLGLAMDIVCVKNSFEKTKEFRWLTAHAHEYGFILRYPKDKQDITKVIYEPWHWRYVGTQLARELKNSGQTLEEYYGVD